MPFKPLSQTIRNQINLFSYLVKYGKNTSKERPCNKTTYSLIGRWEKKGLIEVTKKGRELVIILTEKGKNYSRTMSELVPYLDFFD